MYHIRSYIYLSFRGIKTIFQRNSLLSTLSNGEYIEKARKFASKQKGIADLALTFMNSDMLAEKELEKMLAEKDAEKKLETALLKRMASNKESYYKSLVSTISKR
jgi:NDP-sugar pyrophosphorylase family protein